MAFGKRLRAQRTHSGFTLIALAATLGLGAASTPAVEAQSPTTPASASAPREFVGSQQQAKKAQAPHHNRLKPRLKHGYDSRKARRRILMVMAGKDNSGRQWTRVRRDLRHGAHANLLTLPAWELALLAQKYRLVQAA